jgi:DNA-binding response OmpR family regulator
MSLLGKHILVVEDDYLIGTMVCDMLTDAEAAVVGPARTCDAALALANSETFDAAVLDINLRGEFSDVVAEALERRHIPFIVATGYGEQSQRQWNDAVVVAKPYTEEKLIDTLEQLLKNPA